MHGTVIERTGPVLHRVKVNDQTWKRHVKQLWHSNLCPPEVETTAGCAVAEKVENEMPVKDKFLSRYRKFFYLKLCAKRLTF